jgi:tRNA nucleotidyltransferase (CCA-adding enzyme)
MDLITTHANADFDCLGAMAAAARLYPGAVLSFPGSQEKAVRDFLARHPDYLTGVVRAREIDLESVSRLIVVDCQLACRIGRFAALLERPDLEVHLFDHHPASEQSIRATVATITPCGSSSTILAGLLMERNERISPEEATLIMLGIHEDTGRLLFSSTTRDDYLAAAWLMEQGARLNIVAEALSQELNSQQTGLLRQLLGTLKSTEMNGVTISIAHAASDRYIGDIAALAHLMRDMENLDALFVVVAMEGRVYLVARSRVPEVNVGEILRRFHGGGHATAASATVRDQSLQQVLERLEGMLQGMINRRATAGEIMSSPVKTMPDDVTIAAARELLTRYNCNAMPVMAGERMVGIISRKTVEKALYHDLGDAPATDFMHTEFLRAVPETPISAIQEYMVHRNRRFVPVFDGDRLAGAVTRTDLLRYMHGGRRTEPGALYDVDALGDSPRNRSVAGMVGKRLPVETVRLLRELGAAGDELGLSVYVVGGFVRDLLLGLENLDIDVTVEGDGIFFAEQFAGRHDCRVRSHRAFGTAVVIFPDGRTIDVASTRLEYYESPGMLPTVERSSLRHDLYRRDFTINTLAVCINGACFGRLTDYFGGQQDIQARVVRVLHNLSFVEDPTRVFRAIRFEQRLGFHMAPHTENLIRTALRRHVLDRVGGLRLLNELIQILREKEPRGAISRMAGFNLLPFIHPALRLAPEIERIIDETARVLVWFRLLYLPDPCEQWQVYFLALCDGLKQEDFQEACRRLSMPGRIVTRIFGHRRQALATLDTIQRRLRHGPEPKNSELYAWFHPLPLEMLLYLAARARREEVRRLVSHYVTRLRQMRCSLDGNALAALGLAPGPRYRQILEQLLAARLDGRIATDAEERDLAASLLSGV